MSDAIVSPSCGIEVRVFPWFTARPDLDPSTNDLTFPPAFQLHTPLKLKVASNTSSLLALSITRQFRVGFPRLTEMG